MRVNTLLDTVAQRRPGHLALVFGGRTWSFQHLRDETHRRAAVLAAAGLRPGDVAITAEPQTDDLVLTFLACCRTGVVLCTLSPLFTESEVVALAACVRAVVAFTADGRASAPLQAPRALPIALPGPGGPAVSSDGPEAPAVIRPTSGTTRATPKLVVMPHRQLTWRVAAPAWWETPDDIFYLPMRNHFAVIDVCHVLGSGATLVLSHASSPMQMETEMGKHRATVLLTVPAVLALLARSGKPAPALRLTAIRTSAAHLSLPVRQAAEARYGVPVVQLYGSTESGFAFATTRDGTPMDSIGKPLPHVSARIVDADGSPVEQGDVGEVVVRTPGMMRGYLGDAVATDAVLRAGWAWTGDLGWCDARGFYYLAGRRDARINSSGFKVQPEEVEAVLAAHPGVREVAVTWDPDPLRGQSIRAVIVAAGPPPAAADLDRFCRERLAAYKVPRRFEFVESLPRTALGKVRRSQLSQG